MQHFSGQKKLICPPGEHRAGREIYRLENSVSFSFLFCRNKAFRSGDAGRTGNNFPVAFSVSLPPRALVGREIFFMQNPISEQARAAALAQLDAAEAAREDILVQHIANGVVINSRTVQIDPCLLYTSDAADE